MSLKIGDKVRFLNEQGEGIVTQLIDKKMANVLIPDGFEIPYLMNQLVVILDDSHTTPIIKTETIEENIFLEEEEIPEVDTTFDNGITKGVYLLFTPENQKLLLDSPIQISIGNTTQYTILFTFSVKSGSYWNTIETGSVSNGSTSNILLINRNDITRYSQIKLDVLFYMPAMHDAMEPVSTVIKVNTQTFYKANNFQKSEINNKLTYAVCAINTEPTNNWDDIAIDAEAIKNALIQKQSSTKTHHISKPHNYNFIESEVDLHIEELIDDYRGMTNARIIAIQLAHFQRELDNAIDKNISRIIFIHGVGTGRLKQEIITVLKTYPKIKFQDASYAKYGFGATEVILK